MTERPARRSITSAAAIAAAILLVALGGTLGLAASTALDSGREAGAPLDDSVDAGFARDMSDHHAQAVQMATTIRDRTANPEIRSLALDILLTQQHQIGQMYGWLTAWHLPPTSTGPALSWMSASSTSQPGASTGHDMSGMGEGDSHGRPGGRSMPGMARSGELTRLARLPDRPAQRLFLTLMIRHHRGGVAMARQAASRAEQPVVRRLARSIAAAQTAEIAALRQLLAERGGQLP